MSDHYNLLGVSPDASSEDLRRAFRREAKRCHPDLFADRPDHERVAQQRRFIQLTQAYQLLSDPEQRRAYDRRRAAERERTESARPRYKEAPKQARPAQPASGSARKPPPQSASRGRPGAAGQTSARSAHATSETTPKGGQRQPPVDPAQDLRDILKEAEQSLSKFGMDLRQPADVLLEELLDWARALYRDLVGAVRSAKAGSTRKARQQGADTSGARPHPDAHAKTRATDTTRSQRKAHPEMDSARLNELEVERELARLKQTARTRSAPRAPTVEDELAELKRRHGKKP